MWALPALLTGAAFLAALVASPRLSGWSSYLVAAVYFSLAGAVSCWLWLVYFSLQITAH